jgi:DNA-binding XRE family transcriptional regulator
MDDTARDLRALRVSHDLTQAQLAQAVGCSQEMIAQIESGKKQPGPRLARKIRAILASSSLPDPTLERAPRGAYGDGRGPSSPDK